MLTPLLEWYYSRSLLSLTAAAKKMCCSDLLLWWAKLTNSPNCCPYRSATTSVPRPCFSGLLPASDWVWLDSSAGWALQHTGLPFGSRTPFSLEKTFLGLCCRLRFFPHKPPSFPLFLPQVSNQHCGLKDLPVFLLLHECCPNSSVAYLILSWQLLLRGSNLTHLHTSNWQIYLQFLPWA